MRKETVVCMFECKNGVVLPSLLFLSLFRVYVPNKRMMTTAGEKQGDSS